MPGLGGIIFVLIFGLIVTVWGVWVIGRTEQPRDASGRKDTEHKPPLPDT
jgi:hypothetical protein